MRVRQRGSLLRVCVCVCVCVCVRQDERQLSLCTPREHNRLMGSGEAKLEGDVTSLSRIALPSGLIIGLEISREAAAQ